MSKKIAQLLDEQCVLLNCEAIDAAEVIRAIGEKLLNQGYVKDTFIKAAIDREKELPTGLPLAGGINAAIPHTDIDHVIHPALGMATLKQEVPFQNMANPQETVPVRLVFLLALEQPKAQIEILQEVAKILQNPSLVDDLLRQDTFAGVTKKLNQKG